MRKKPSTMDLSKGAFIVYGQGGWWWARGGAWWQKFRDLFSWRSEEGEGGLDFFLVHYFSGVFFERDIICIRTQTHKGMLLKYGGGKSDGGKREVDKNFHTRSWGWGEICFPCIPCILEKGGGAIFGGATNFAKPPPPPPPALNNEHSLRKQKEYIQWIHDAHWCSVRTVHLVIIKQIWQITINFMIMIIFIYFDPLLVFLLLSQPGKGENRSGVRAYWFILGLLSSWFRTC